MEQKSLDNTTSTKIDFSAILSRKFAHYPFFLRSWILKYFPEILKEREINDFLEKNFDKKGYEFIDELFEFLDFSYTLAARDKEKIPAEGKLLIVANHPQGALDGLALLKVIKEVRSDVRIVVNDILWQIVNLRELFLPNDSSFTKNFSPEDVQAISLALKKEEAVIIFPASDVTRLTIAEWTAKTWRKEIISFAKLTETPILPVFIRASNSILFYILSIFSNRIAMLLLPSEILNKRKKTILIKIGDPIPNQHFHAIKSDYAIKLLKSHIEAISANRKGPFRTEKTVIHPVNRKELREEILQGNLLGKTENGKMIFFLDFPKFPITMREISRLREITFRKMEEGTGNKRDLDEYDKYYKHLVLWDESALEIVGAYRLGICKEILETKGTNGLYISSLFDLTPQFEKYLPETIELGRSFVQQRYWNSSALDYLWHGIGAFLAHHPEIKFMIGPVTISPSYIPEAKDMLVYFYKKWFSAKESLAKSKNSFYLSPKKTSYFDSIFPGESYKDDFKHLKQNLKHFGATVPTLYKQYTELCEDEGVSFFDFGVDESFGNCIDGLIMVEMEKIKERKKQRYIYSKITIEQNPPTLSDNQPKRSVKSSDSSGEEDAPDAES